ncbi:hypothetical protein [Thermospira aquatica]|uniref:Uncharacterized protein n=1 Tax=Thermospira aquatica TaxID=2828656 RepID=A0AAX3BD10_9SPIR|nr:hypothetical protein [Thermospira aquatica]URA10137.1 hypothetical protein KDW03_11755 [Thermospira aquatica]
MMTSVAELFRNGCAKVEWETHLLDQQWPTLEMARLAAKIEDQFYWYCFVRNFRWPWGREFFYRRAKKKHPQDFPQIIQWDHLRLENLGELVPGNLLSQTDLLGYICDISSNFPPELGTSPTPLMVEWLPLKQALNDVIGAFQRLAKKPSWLGDLENLSIDFAYCYDLLVYLGQLWQYASQNKKSFLRSGHVFWWVEQSYLLGTNIYEILKREGILAVSVGNQTLYAVFQSWLEKMRRFRLGVLVDMYGPVFLDRALRIVLEGEEISIRDISPLPTTWISKLMDRLFPMAVLPRIATVKHGNKTPELPQKRLEEVVEEVANRPSSEELNWDLVVFEAKEFVRMRQLLKDFVTMMVADLSPHYNAVGELVESKHRFDQFDVPPLMRRLERERFILKGKIRGLSPLELAEKDELVIKSTHWLYDRIHDLLERYVFSQSGVRGEMGKHFIEELEGLFTTSSEEYNEIRKYGTFAQFRFNVRRIFSSVSLQSKYLSHIQQMEQSLSRLKELLAHEEVRLMKGGSSTLNY